MYYNGLKGFGINPTKIRIMIIEEENLSNSIKKMIKLTDILNEGVFFYGDAKVVMNIKSEDVKIPSQQVGFKFSYVKEDYIGKGETLTCIPKSSKDLDKIDTLGSISKNDITKQLKKN